MAEVHPSLALDTHSLPSANEDRPLTSPRALLAVSESSEESNESDTAPDGTRLDSHSKQIEDDISEPPYPPFNIWNMPRAKIPLESYKEMTLACRFVPTDQWLTTRVDRTWTVSQVKHHMLTKIWGGRRYQLTLPRYFTHPSKPEAAEQTIGEDGTRRMSISSSDYSDVVFASGIPGDYERSHYTFDAVINTSSTSLEQSVKPDMPDGGRTPRLTRSLSSTELASRGGSPSPSSSHRRGQSVSGERPPSNHSDSMIRDLKREEAMDRLYERMEQTVKRRVLKAAKNYRVVSFSNGNFLDDKDSLSTYGIKPFELLEIQPLTQCVRLARPTYLEPYFETDSMVRVRGGAEKHGVEFLKRLQQLQQEEKAKAELAKAMSALGMDDDQNRPGNEWGTGLSAATKLRNLEEKKAEERRRVLLEQARRDEEKKKKRERKEQESEKWKYRKMIVEGHDLNLWRDHLHDEFPEQSWDLRRVVEVKIPRPPEAPPMSPTQSAYAAVALSGKLQSVSTRPPDKQTKKEVQNEVSDQPTLHIRFSIPLSSVHASLNPAAAAAVHAARLKQAAKANTGSTYLTESLASMGASSTRRLDSTDPYNQGIGFGTSTLDGAGTASLVLRFPNERTREHFCRIVHRSAGKYPLTAKNRRKLAFEPVADLIPVPDPEPERTREHGAPFPEWRARVLKKSIASGRSGFLSSPAWVAVLNEATGQYGKPERVSGPADKGKGPAMPYDDDMEEGYESDNDDCASLVSDTEWEGWRRELEMDRPPKHVTVTVSGANMVSSATPKASHSIATIKEDAVLSSGNLSAIAPENIARSDEEARLLTPIQRRDPPLLPREGSLRFAKRVVVEGIAGKGLIMPATNTFVSWTSFSSNSSANSSFSHEEYRAGEGSDTTANRKPRLSPIVTTPARAAGSGSLARAKSVTMFSLNQNVTVPRVSSSAPISAAMDSHDAWKPALSSPPTALPAESIDEMDDDLPGLNPDVILPGMGGGLGNPAMFPAYVDMGATVTTVSSGRQANGGKKSLGKSGGKWLSKSFVKGTDEASGSATSSVLSSLSRRSSSSNVASIVRSISKRDR